MLQAVKKEEEPSTEAPCKINKEYFFVSGPDPVDSITVLYEGSNISKLQFSKGGYYGFEYNGNKLVKRGLYDTGSTAYDYERKTGG